MLVVWISKWVSKATGQCLVLVCYIYVTFCHNFISKRLILFWSKDVGFNLLTNVDNVDFFSWHLLNLGEYVEHVLMMLQAPHLQSFTRCISSLTWILLHSSWHWLDFSVELKCRSLPFVKFNSTKTKNCN